MSKVRDELDRLVQQLERQRDELRLKMHLGKAEARDEWQRLEQKWEQVRAKLPQAHAVLGETSNDVAAALKLAVEEIGRGYDRLRKLL